MKCCNRSAGGVPFAKLFVQGEGVFGTLCRPFELAVDVRSLFEIGGAADREGGRFVAPFLLQFLAYPLQSLLDSR